MPKLLQGCRSGGKVWPQTLPSGKVPSFRWPTAPGPGERAGVLTGLQKCHGMAGQRPVCTFMLWVRTES